MRHAGALLLTVTLLASLSRSADGQSSPLRLIVNGQEVSLVASPIAYNGVLMIPLPGVFEPLGSSAVWLPEEQAVVISNRTRALIRLRINDPYALVGSDQRLLPIAPVLLRDIPFIPAAAVFGLLGAWVKFDEEERALRVSSVVSGITLQRPGGMLRLTVQASGPVQAETRRLTNPERMVIDLRQAVFRLPDQETAVNAAGVARVRVAQFQARPPITRIVLDLTQPVDVRVQDSPTSFDLTIDVRPRRPETHRQGAVFAPVPAPTSVPSASPVTPADPGAGAPAGDSTSSPAQGTPSGERLKIMQVRLEQASGMTRILVEGTASMQYVVRELVEPDRLVVDVPDAVFIPVKQEIPVNSPAVENVRAAQFQANPDIARVVVTLKRKVPYSISTDAGGSTLVISVVDAPLRGHAVVLDPGHGGKDPGAIGPTGLMEKDVTLDIALRVRGLLVEDGIRVIMTRETDVFIDLAERPRLGRERGGTVFVSIHANANAQTTVNGSETYYLSPVSLSLAQMIQDELTRSLGLPSRGIKTANFLVLRENSIPSVLVEVAFISHPQEEARLREDAFRARIAAAVARGIRRFLAIYPVPAGL
ncbi:MAG: N-acetylmuramoyl-L-alanine amidase [Armatimonadota bacterium]|nr:N-acetylmuramoyl-L-alanine amidase [Armatimonadota bacterium]